VSTTSPTVDAIRRRVPGFPDDLGPILDEPMRRALSAGVFQNLMHASTLVLPGIDRQPFLDGATFRDLLYWVEGIDADGSTTVRPVAERGTYMSATTALRPVAEPDIPRLYYSALDPSTAHRWRFRGTTPSPEDFRAMLFGQGVLAQFAVIPRDEPGVAAGVVTAYAADQTARHCYVAVLRADNHARQPGVGHRVLEGTILFLEYLFDHFDLTKIYFEIPEYNLGLFAGWTGSILREEGRLRDHYVHAGRSWDQYIFALYRTDWDAVIELYRDGSAD